MYLSDLIRRSLRSLTSAKIRTVLTALAIAVGGFTLTLTLAASNGAREYSNRLIANNFDPSELLVAKDKQIFNSEQQKGPKEYDESQINFENAFGGSASLQRLSQADIDAITKVEGVESIRPNYTVTPQFITREGQKRYNATIEVYGNSQEPDIVAGEVGEMPAKGEVVLPEDYIKALGFSSPEDAIGKTIEANFQKSNTLDPVLIQQALTTVLPPAKPGQPPPPPVVPDITKLQALQEPLKQTFTVVAVSKMPAGSLSFGTALPLHINDEDAAGLNKFMSEGTADAEKFLVVTVKVRDGQNKANVEKVQAALDGMGFNVQSVEETQQFLSGIIDYLQYVVTGFGVITLIASIFGIVNTQYISVLERTREIGLMKALGMRGSSINLLFMFEATWIGFLGGLIGALLGVGLSTIVNPTITKALNLGDGNQLLVNKWWQVIILIVALMLIATLAGLLPARKAAKLDPIEALRTE